MHSKAVCGIVSATIVAAAGIGGRAMGSEAEKVGRVKSADGVEIVYSQRGSGEPALVLIHGGLADRAFWAPQQTGLSDTYRVVALDLGGHGESGRNRAEWRIASWAEDLRAVVDALGLKKVVLVGNSLGGAVALEAARILPGRAIAVIGVDTLHDATHTIEPAAAKARAEAVRKDPVGACRAMIEQLFHPGAQADLRAWSEKRMCATSPEVFAGMMEGFVGYDGVAAFRNAGVPIRAINGDLWPTLIEGNRKVTPDFDAVIMKNAGHYPQLERPEEFNRHLDTVVKALAVKPTS